MPSPLYVAIDIETLGPGFQNDVIMIGVAIGDDHHVIETMAFCGPVDLRNMDDKCYRDFWSKHEDILARIMAEADDDFLNEFMVYYYSLDKRFPTKDIVLLSDNPAFDITRIDALLHKNTFRYPLRYSNSGQYRNVIDVDMVMLPVERQVAITTAVDALCNAKNCHWAEEDARKILLTWLAIQSSLPAPTPSI